MYLSKVSQPRGFLVLKIVLCVSFRNQLALLLLLFWCPYRWLFLCRPLFVLSVVVSSSCSFSFSRMVRWRELALVFDPPACMHNQLVNTQDKAEILLWATKEDKQQAHPESYRTHHTLSSGIRLNSLELACSAPLYSIHRWSRWSRLWYPTVDSCGNQMEYNMISLVYLVLKWNRLAATSQQKQTDIRKEVHNNNWNEVRKYLHFHFSGFRASCSSL